MYRHGGSLSVQVLRVVCRRGVLRIVDGTALDPRTAYVTPENYDISPNKCPVGAILAIMPTLRPKRAENLKQTLSWIRAHHQPRTVFRAFARIAGGRSKTRSVPYAAPHSLACLGD